MNSSILMWYKVKKLGVFLEKFRSTINLAGIYSPKDCNRLLIKLWNRIFLARLKIMRNWSKVAKLMCQNPYNTFDVKMPKESRFNWLTSLWSCIFIWVPTNFVEFKPFKKYFGSTPTNGIPWNYTHKVNLMFFDIVFVQHIEYIFECHSLIILMNADNAHVLFSSWLFLHRTKLKWGETS